MIYTFYSYKGGVGRSMALANVAECFCAQGLRVLMIDWDLEAPGLESFFFEQPGSDGDPAALEGISLVQSKLGIIDMLTEYKRSYTSLRPVASIPPESLPKAFREAFQAATATSDAITPTGTVSADNFEDMLEKHLPPLSTYLFRLHGSPSTASYATGGDTPGELSLLPAGWRHKERFQAYGLAVQGFDWEDFYRSYQGKQYFDWLRRKLLEVADVVLIDSRTGVTEMGGVCARQMADVVVAFCASNYQNVNGVTRMVQSFKRPETIAARDNRALDTLIVPTRVDSSDQTELLKFLDRFQGAVNEPENSPAEFKEVGSKFWDLRIPYKAAYSYRERLLVGPRASALDPTKELENAYWRIACHLALLAPETHAIRQKFAARLQREFPALLPGVVLSYMPEVREFGLSTRAAIQSAGLKLWPDLDHQRTGSEDPSQWTGVISRSKHVVFVTAPGGYGDDSVIRREVRLARQLGKAVYAICPGEGLSQPPFWLASAEIYDRVSPELIEKLQSPLYGLSAPVMGPTNTQLYVERPQEQNELKAALLQAATRSSSSACALWGLGGVGKTRLAARICQDEDVIDTFSGGILWANADDPDALQKIVIAVIGQPVTGDVMGAAKGLMHNRRYLLIVDNVWQPEDYDRFHVLDGKCTFLVVTRDLSVAGASGSATVTLSSMEPEQAFQLVSDGRWSSEANQELPAAGKDLIAKLNYWPLALSLARAALQEELALAGDEAKALVELEDRVDRHGMVAFDLPVVADSVAATSDATVEHEQARLGQRRSRETSMARSLEATLERLNKEEGARLEQLVANAATSPMSLGAVLELWRPAASKPPGGPQGPPQARAKPTLPRGKDSDTEALELLRRLSSLGLVNLDRKADSVSVHPVVLAIFREQGLVDLAAPAEAERHLSSGQDRRTNENVARAQAVLGGQSLSFGEIVDLAKWLKNSRYFSYARQMFARARAMREGNEQRVFLGQQHALCTYKDPDLPTLEKLDRALEILQEVDDLATTRKQETLGLAGSIFRQKWEADGQRLNLERSLAYYARGYQQGIENDCAYTAINTAFVLDLLALQEEKEYKKSSPSPDASQSAVATQPLQPVSPNPSTELIADSVPQLRREQAERIRLEIVHTLPAMARRPNSDLKRQYWFLVTVAEAYFGLQQYDDARYWLKEAMALEVVDWEFGATARQLARLAFLQNGGVAPAEDSPPYRTLKLFLNNDTAALTSIAIGKVGLALSGGGFRASLFHIGVLAKLAEQDILRHVEVISCVSGGSIIGAHYYLELKNLLERKTDSEITQQDYLNVVAKVERDFLSGVQQNLRTRLFANPFVNWATLLWPNYTRTERLATLMEKHLFKKASGRNVHWMDELIIKPPGTRADFSPKFDNWRRAAKVPVLVLNATTLNTGHNWQFTATWMGEPPGAISTEIDGNDLLRRMYYWEAPPKYRRVRLGRAVAASACVPALFDPIRMDGLFPKRTVALVDGGVHDNQGTASLAEQECSVMLVSDASGQMGSTLQPSGEALQISMRSTDILMARVREAEFQELEGRRLTAQLKGFAFMHLKKDLDVDPVNWVDCAEPYEMFDEARPTYRRGPLTSYGVLKDVQRQLAAIRTDLDSFSDIEAYTLMLSGYRITEHEVQNCLQSVFQTSAEAGKWRFAAMEKAMSRAKDFEEAYDRMLARLRVAHSRAFKVWKLSPALPVFGIIVVALVIFGVWHLSKTGAWLFGALGALGIGTLIALTFLFWLLSLLFRTRKSFSLIFTGVLVGTVGWVVGVAHLLIFDKIFLADGRCSPRTENAPEPAAGHPASSPTAAA
jgi:predicted acylesterase/phospholipase RssA